MILYAGAIFLGAFLLFLVQPIIAKQILPWFGGSAAVWATCMVFFQVVLLAGYAYADLTTRRLTPKRQVALHVGLLVVSLLVLPITPSAAWKPLGDENPSWRILGLLAVTIGPPYLLLSTTSPLLQAWFARRFLHTAPYRLFALSNLASLLALLAYPVLIEPWVSTATQSMTWSVLYALFALLCGYAAISSARWAAPAPAPGPSAAAPGEAAPSGVQRLIWLILPAMASFLLLAVTNHICQNVASLPFLWILPLGLYLGTFILCFDHPRWYRRNVFLVLAAIVLPWMGWYSDSLDLKLVVPMYLVGLFVCCMFCHGELTLVKPAPRYLTTYYFMIALGGAISGLLVGLAAPYLLTGYFELAIGLVACALLLLYRTAGIAWWAVLGSAAAVAATAWGAGKAVDYQITSSRMMLRNFYSVVRTRDDTTPVRFRSMVHGGIVYGGQLLDPELRFHPSSYFGPTSGYGRLFASLPDRPRRIGVIGLGAGSMVAYARAGDTFRFYEINPQVLELARREFTFLTDSPATVEVVLGDGRLSLEREPGHQFDVLAMDAFSGDSIPMHLLTREAMAIYLRHLKPGGVLAFQATNRFIDIAPVVASLAQERGLTAVLISDTPQSTEGVDYWLSGTDQILVTSDRALLESEPIR
ncbi:MAG: spermidine synthase, partial [Caulobacteraceae bacterium]